MRIMQVKRRSHKFLPHKFLLCHMHKTLECMNNKQKCIKFIKRAILMNLHKFVMHKKMSHHGIYAPKIMGHTRIKVCTHVLWVWFGGVAYLFRLSSPVPVDRTPLQWEKVSKEYLKWQQPKPLFPIPPNGRVGTTQREMKRGSQLKFNEGLRSKVV